MSKELVKLNLGSGIVVKKGFINVDLYDPDDLKNHTGICTNSIWEKGAKYIQADIRKLPFEDDYADIVEMFEVLEHMPFRDIVPTLKEVRRVMKKGGKLLMHTPNFDGLMKDWLNIITLPFNIDDYINVMETIYGNQLAGGEFHHAALNPQFMNWCLVEAGFTDGNLFIVPKHSKIPEMGSEKIDKNTIARNEILMVEVTK